VAWYSHNCRQQVSGLSVASKRYLTVTSTSLAEPLDSCQRPCSIAIFKLLGYATRILSYSDDYAARSEWASESFLIIARPRKAEFRQVLGKALFFSPNVSSWRLHPRSHLRQGIICGGISYGTYWFQDSLRLVSSDLVIAKSRRKVYNVYKRMEV